MVRSAAEIVSEKQFPNHRALRNARFFERLSRRYLVKWNVQCKKHRSHGRHDVQLRLAPTNTGPAPQSDNMQKPGMNNVDKGSMNNSGMSKEGMSKDSMSKDGMKKDGMKK